MKWQKEHCVERPLELDFKSSPGHVIQRKDITPVKKVDEETKEERVEYECLMRFLTIKQWMEELEKEKQLLGVQMSEREIQEISQGQQISNLEIKLLELQGGM